MSPPPEHDPPAGVGYWPGSEYDRRARLQARIAELEADNRRLRSALERERSAHAGAEP